VLRKCHDRPLGGHFGHAKTGSLVRHLAFWVRQDVDITEYVRSCQTFAGLPTTTAGFDMNQNHIDLLSCKVDAVPTCSMATAADAAATRIIHDMCLRSGDSFPDVLVVDHDSKFTSKFPDLRQGQTQGLELVPH
jgi:hypothetical protein